MGVKGSNLFVGKRCVEIKIAMICLVFWVWCFGVVGKCLGLTCWGSKVRILLLVNDVLKLK
ncbi:unnamed protein product [Meloidogyne enterolobii]|uniref:Uncharacterized protein n=1 Tax=Meloidogyne enterolobii TaxID=390850 RepID=A0ACB1B6Z1_MELEN